MLLDRGADAHADALAALLSLHMVLYTAEGRQRRAAELTQLLEASGFERPLTLPTAGSFSVVSAVKSLAAPSGAAAATATTTPCGDAAAPAEGAVADKRRRAS